MKSIRDWFVRLIRGKPHFYVGGEKNPYLIRWYLIPRNPLINVYLHKFLRDDDDRALHCHPWWFISVMIWGKYYEFVDKNGSEAGAIVRSAPSIAFRSATHCHRVKLPRMAPAEPRALVPIPCWTIVITGPKCRVWWFHCPKGFVPWFDFVDHADTGNVGKGCGE